ncbi:MAG: hypothetical protein EOP86_01510 [Verrucomicrobiaceae bacterium]|nr:MAG: hypothetical protein EOP86_01510 [Verrucomicrobiaceae bacterium]
MHHKITFRLRLSCLAGTGLLLLIPPAVRAADFYQIMDATSATVDFDYYNVLGLIEGPEIGFESAPPYNRLSDTTWVTNDPNGFPGNYFDPLPDPGPKLVFDLGSNVDLAEISVWGYSTGIEGNSLKDFSLRFATEAEGPDGAGGSLTFNPTYSAGPQVSPRQSFLFGQKLTARYVELTPLNNNIGLGPGGDRVGFSEVAFQQMPNVTGSFAELPTEHLLGDASVLRTITLDVLNLGPQALTLTSPTFTGTAAAAYSVVTLPASVPAYSKAGITLQFNPVGLPPGDASVVFHVNTNTAGLPTADVTITANVPAEAADQFYSMVAATSATDATDYFKVAGLIDGPGVGFNAEQPHEQPTAAPLWVTDAPNGGTGDYFEPVPDPAPSLVIDLGADYPLGEISVWGYSDSNANGASDFNLKFAKASEGAAGIGTSITYNPQFTAAFGFTERQSFDLAQVVTARYVRIVPTDNYYGSGKGPGGDRVGFGNIAFEKIITTTGKNLIFPNTVSFGATDTGKTFSLVLKNYGSEAVTISSRTLDGPNAAAFTIKSAPAILPAVSQALVELEFNPAAATLGTQEAFLRIASNDTTNPAVTIQLTGEYVTLPDEFYPIAEVTSETSGTDLYPAAGLINGIGTGFENIQPHHQIDGNDAATLWVTDAPNGTVNYFEPAPDPAPLLIFDLGGDVDLTEISVWGYSIGNSNGMRDFSLNFATGAEGPYGGGSITYNPAFTVPFSFTERNSFPFDRKITAQYVLLKPLNNWGTEGVAPGGDRVGIGEVAFQMGAAIVTPAGDFGITAFSRNAQGQPLITFGSQTGATFKVQRSVDLNTWTQVGSDIPGTAGSADFTDTTAAPAGATSVFYRVVRTIP